MQETIRSLRLFNKNVIKLKSLRFTKAILNAVLGYLISGRQGQDVIFRRYGLDDESVDARHSLETRSYSDSPDPEPVLGQQYASSFPSPPIQPTCTT